MIYHEYRDENLTHVPMNRRYLSYTDIGNQTIYFKEVTFKFLDQAWEFASLKEEWYHIQNSVSIVTMMSSKESSVLFPNPCSTGQLIHVQIDQAGEDPIDLLVFDLHGQLVSMQHANNSATLISPQLTGFYMVVFRSQDRFIGTSRLFVAE